jgi:hypothetical protein
MKFKKSNEYDRPAVSDAPKIEQGHPSAPASIQVQEVHQWECVACSAHAVVLHKGTGYCRAHYDARAYNGSLIN